MGLFLKTSNGTETLSDSSSSQDLFDKIYPVGAVYISTSNVDPATLFGGSWTQIQDRFLLAAGSSHAAGSTGGSENVTLTTSQIPSHTHSVGGHTHSVNSHTHSIPSLRGTAASAGNHSHTVSINTTGSESDGYGLDWFDGFKNRVMVSGGAYGTGSGGAHTHSVSTNASTSGSGGGGSTGFGGSGSTDSAGSGSSHNNMPPYLSVYMWQRTA